MATARRRELPARREEIEVEATVLRLPEDEPKGIQALADPTCPRGLLLVFAGAPPIPLGLVQPFAVFRTDEGGFARLVAAAPIARVVYGNEDAIRWLLARMKRAEMPVA